jgi:hypothetical protein
MADKPTVTEMMIAYAQDAVDHAQASSGVALDYSFDSIRGVEEILEKLRAALPRGCWGKLFGKGPSKQDVDQVCKMYGGYLGVATGQPGSHLRRFHRYPGDHSGAGGQRSASRRARRRGVVARAGGLVGVEGGSGITISGCGTPSSSRSARSVP